MSIKIKIPSVGKTDNPDKITTELDLGIENLDLTCESKTKPIPESKSDNSFESAIQFFGEDSETVVDTLPEISDDILAYKTELHPAEPIHETDLSFIDGLNPEFDDFTQTYCLHTGKPLDRIPHNTITNLIEIHGKERTKTVLKAMQYTYAPEWILTDDIGLSNLARKQPREYLIFALTHLLPKQIDELSEHKTPCYEFEAKNAAWNQLQNISDNLVIDCAEHVRRILSQNRPPSIRENLRDCRIDLITKNAVNLGAFLVKLQSCLQKLNEGYYDPDKIAARDKAFQQYAAQRRLKALSSLEINLANLGFNLWDDNPNVDIAGIRAGNTYKHTAKKLKIKQRQKGTKPHTLNKPFTGLKLKGASK